MSLDIPKIKKSSKAENVPSLRTSIKNILGICIPTIITMISVSMIMQINIGFAGRLNDTYILAGIGIANMYTNTVIQSLIIGMNSTLNTLVSQAFGQKNLKLCGTYLNRARVIITLMFIPFAIPVFYAESILLKLGFDKIACHYVGIYSVNMIPGFYF